MRHFLLLTAIDAAFLPRSRTSDISAGIPRPGIVVDDDELVEEGRAALGDEDGDERGVWRTASARRTVRQDWLQRTVARRRYCLGQRTLARCAGVLLVAAVAALSGVFFDYAARRGSAKHDTYVPLMSPQDTGRDGTHGPWDAAALFRIAKSVNERCQEHHIRTSFGRWECQELCRPHMCCLYAGCPRDEDELCGAFAGCEVLVLEDPTERPAGPNASGGADVPAPTHGGAAPVEHGDVSEEAAGYEDEDEPGWREIRREHVHRSCEGANVRSESGRRQCERVCEGRFCCFDATPDGDDCREDARMTCDLYAACRTLLTGGALNVAINTATLVAISAAEAVPDASDAIDD